MDSGNIQNFVGSSLSRATSMIKFLCKIVPFCLRYGMNQTVEWTSLCLRIFQKIGGSG